ncbi:GMP synthase family protein [Onchocerca flexuosa]|uniref:GMP synthase (glutamine-hydrolyzing) n=1 Tax=Onchocerca flexuosa TaxID=387005 RepID=A0A238C555_9BILA|nr:GMP synthase family protein [Onchocerca flexuosa]
MHSSHNLPGIYTDEYFSASEQEKNVVPVRGAYLKLPNTGSSLSSSLEPNNPTNPISDSSRNKSDTLDSTKSSDSSSLSRTLPNLSKKHTNILRPFLRKKTKRSSSSGNSLGSGSDHRETNRNSEGEAMKRTASPTLPDGATQAKYEPSVCNGEIDMSSSFLAVNATIGMDSLKQGKKGEDSPSLQRTIPLINDSRIPCSMNASVSMEVQLVDCTNGKQATDVPNGITANATHLNSTKLENAYKEGVAIVDFGAQFGKVIDRRIREQNVFSEILPFNTKAANIVEKGCYKAIILSGGPNSVNSFDAPEFDPAILTCGIPVLGICYGFQLINKAFGGYVSKKSIREDGQLEIDVDTTCPLFKGLATRQKVLLTHSDSVTERAVANDFKIVGRSGNFVAAIADERRKLYGVQFHPEVDLSICGKEILHNFLFDIAGITGGFTIDNREQKCIQEIRSVVMDKKVLVMVSGGVDSTVCAALLHKALGSDRVIAIHIDNGFMRCNESDHVVESLNKLNLKVRRYNAFYAFMNGRISFGSEFSTPLMRTVEPEVKRKIIGDTFMRVKDKIMDELKLDKDIFLAQGTLRPDLIESASHLASSYADVIKTHHNDSALVRELRNLGKVLEPLKDFHKDEVRELGISLGLPEHIVHRHPFPGPGLAIRIICAERPLITDFDLFITTQHHLHLIANLPLCDKDHLSEVDLKAISDHDFEIATTLLPIQSVGVQGDGRSYAYAAALSTNERPIPWELLERLAYIIPRLLHNINRVVYVFGNAIEYPVNDVTRTYLNGFTVGLIRWADRIAYDVLYGLDENGKRDPALEMPVVMIPVHFDRDPLERKASTLRSFVLRPFITNDFMTGVAALPGKDIPEQNILEIVRRITEHVPLTSRVMIDLTSKPPGTTEWE